MQVFAKLLKVILDWKFCERYYFYYFTIDRRWTHDSVSVVRLLRFWSYFNFIVLPRNKCAIHLQTLITQIRQSHCLDFYFWIAISSQFCNSCFVLWEFCYYFSKFAIGMTFIFLNRHNRDSRLCLHRNSNNQTILTLNFTFLSSNFAINNFFYSHKSVPNLRRCTLKIKRKSVQSEFTIS